MTNYGAFLKAIREAKNLTLRDVERKTDVSNAYLSQLESGKVKQPSPTLLYKLAQLYGVPYENLMEKVGYPVPKTNIENKTKLTVSSKRFGSITSEEEIELINYLKFIRNRKTK